MEPAKIYVDHRSVAFPEVASPPVVVAGVVGRTPVAVRLSVHVYDPEAGHRWSGTGVDAAQEWSTTSVLVPRDALTLPEAVAEAGPVARFGNGVSAYLPQGPPAAGEPLTVLWTVDEPVETDLSAFVHVIVDGEMRGAFDRAPATSAPLPTSYWRPGDVVPGWFPVEVPAGAGNIAIRLGLYATDGDRVPAFRPDGSQWPDDAVVVPVRP
jgi:hypothetical protein